MNGRAQSNQRMTALMLEWGPGAPDVPSIASLVAGLRKDRSDWNLHKLNNVELYFLKVCNHICLGCKRHHRIRSE